MFQWEASDFGVCFELPILNMAEDKPALGNLIIAVTGEPADIHTPSYRW